MFEKDYIMTVFTLITDWVDEKRCINLLDDNAYIRLAYSATTKEPPIEKRLHDRANRLDNIVKSTIDALIMKSDFIREQIKLENIERYQNEKEELGAGATVTASLSASS